MAIKIVSDNKNSFFVNNIISISNTIPTSGTYKVGDIVISSTQSNNIFGWVCTVAGSPGTWKSMIINIENGTITMDKLSNDVKQAIEDASNIDLSDYLTSEPYTGGETAEDNVIERVIANAEKIGELETQMDEVFQNVSNGKNLVATAITDKGVSTSSDATFSTMANNISSITTAKDIKVDGVAIGSDFELTHMGYKWFNTTETVLPYIFYLGFAVVYNNEIHILGSSDSSYCTNHYKWNGVKWVKISTLPYNFYYGSAVVYNNEIHILGGSNNTNLNHYKWNGSSWSSVSTLPYTFMGGSVVIYDNKIHILGSELSSSRMKHYSYNGSSWTSVSTLPYSFYNGGAVVYNNEIHIIGGSGNNTLHCKWNGSAWETNVTTLPYSFYNGLVILCDNKINILGSNNANHLTSHYEFNGSSWTSVSTLPYSFYGGSGVIFNDEIHILGGNAGNTNHYFTKNVYGIINK